MIIIEFTIACLIIGYMKYSARLSRDSVKNEHPTARIETNINCIYDTLM